VDWEKPGGKICNLSAQNRAARRFRRLTTD
jgi:hypothetical protein